MMHKFLQASFLSSFLLLSSLGATDAVEEVGFARNHCHRFSHPRDAIPISVAISQNLWRRDAMYLKDAFQLVAAGSVTEEIITVNQLIANNAIEINNFIYGLNNLNSTDIQNALMQMTVDFYIYIETYLINPDSLPPIIENLQEDNERIYEAISIALSLNPCERNLILFALERRLEALKDVALAFINARIGEYDEAFTAVNQAIQTGQTVGLLIGQIKA